MVDSGTFTPDVLARRYAMAQQLLTPPKGGSTNWAQGLNEMARSALGGYQLNKYENQERQSRADANAQIAAALGLPAPPPPKLEPGGFDKIASLFGGGPSNAPSVDGSPPDASAAPSMPDQSNVMPSAGGNVPASIRYNNPGAQWPGPSSDRFGSTGSGVIGGGNKIAQFPDPVSGAAAQFDLLGKQYAGMPLGAAIQKWSGGNSAPQYTASVAQATGLSPNTPITPDLLKNPQVAIPLAKAMAKVETGRDYPMSDQQWQQAHAMAFNGAQANANPLASIPPQLAGPNDLSPLDTALPPPDAAPGGQSPVAPPVNAPPVQQGPAPGILGSPHQPPAARAAMPGPTGAPPAGLGANPNAGKIAMLLTNPWIDPGVKSALMAQMAPQYGFQTLPDGTVVRTNPRTGQIEPVYHSEKPLGFQTLPDGTVISTNPLTGEVKPAYEGSKPFGFQTLADGTIVRTNPKTGSVEPIYQSTKPQFQKLKGPLGEDIPIFVDPTTQKITNAQGGTGGPGGSLGGIGVYAPGVSQIDSSKTGDEYLNQFSPEVKAIAHAYINGDQMPTGNPRLQGMLPIGKTVATKYAADQGIPFSDTTYAAKRQLQTQLSSGAPSSLGGRLNALRNAFDHLANASDTALKKDNINAGLSFISSPLNELKSTTTSQRDISNQLEREATTYGGERTKFLTGGEGSESERRAFLNALGPNSAAPPQMAGAIEGEYNQIKSALMNQDQQIRTQMGDDYLKRNPIITPEVKTAMDRIEKNIGFLRNGKPSNPQQTAPTTGTPVAPIKVSSPDEARKLPKGTRIILPDGTPGVVP